MLRAPMFVQAVVRPAAGLTTEAITPKYAKPGDAGCDACANISEPVYILPGQRALIPSGVFAAVPTGYRIEVCPRSGWALKEGVTVLNTPGTIDAGFRNEIGVILINHSNKEITVNPGDRIAQFILSKVEYIQWMRVDELPDSVRGMSGFGSTGVANGTA